MPLTVDRGNLLATVLFLADEEEEEDEEDEEDEAEEEDEEEEDKEEVVATARSCLSCCSCNRFVSFCAFSAVASCTAASSPVKAVVVVEVDNTLLFFCSIFSMLAALFAEEMERERTFLFFGTTGTLAGVLPRPEPTEVVMEVEEIVSASSTLNFLIDRPSFLLEPTVFEGSGLLMSA